MSNYEAEVIQAMERYGGSFVKNLAALYRSADVQNRMKIRLAFTEYWNMYQKVAEEHAASASVQPSV